MKKVSVLAATAGILFGLVSASSQAATQTATGTFNVTINFTSVCTVNTTTLTPAFAYTDNQGTPATATGGLNYSVTCTNGVPYSMVLDTNGGTFSGTYTVPTGTGSYTNTASGLKYTLTLPTALAGTGAAQTYTLSGNMAALQVGTCTTAGGCIFTDTHTLTITY